MQALYYLGWGITRISSKLLGRITISGQEHFPGQGGFILATNHISYFDPPLVGSWAPREVYFLAKRELFRPVAGWILREVNALPVRRGAVDRKALQMCLDTIEDGKGLVIFPEGTRIKRAEMLPPKPGIGRIAVKAGCPIVIGFLWGSDRISRVVTGRDPMGIRYAPGLTVEEVLSFSDDKAGWQALAEDVMTRIKSLRDEVLEELKPDRSQPDK